MLGDKTLMIKVSKVYSWLNKGRSKTKSSSKYGECNGNVENRQIMLHKKKQILRWTLKRWIEEIVNNSARYECQISTDSISIRLWL